MKTQIRLNSVVPHGVSGPDAGAIELIYEALMIEYKQSAYRYISINQIGNDLDEVMIKEGKNMHLNIRYPSPADFNLKTDEEKNRIRLDVLHSALIRIAEKDKKLDIEPLEAIKNKILDNKFSFDFVIKTYLNKKNKNLSAKLIVHPSTDKFDYYIQIDEQNQLKCNLLIYSGGTTGSYVADLFKLGKWKNDNNFILSGKSGEVEIYITIDQCKVDYVNLTRYEKAPLFEMFRSNNSQEERDKAKKNWSHSLPPAISGITRPDTEN